MQLSELITEVQDIIQDGAWSSVKITSLLNEGLKRVANGVLIQGKYQVTPPLPNLHTVGAVTTTLNSGVCQLPTDFNRSLVLVVNADENVVTIEDSFIRFTQRYGRSNDSGSVRVCTRHGNNLIYRDIPSTAETLTVHYYCNPTLLVAASDEPSCIPEVMQSPLLVSYACSKIFEQIEDGIEGQKINTAFWLNKWHSALFELEILVGHDGSPDYYEDSTARCV